MPGLILENDAAQNERSPTPEENGTYSSSSTDSNWRTYLQAMQAGADAVTEIYHNFIGYACRTEHDPRRSQNNRRTFVIRFFHPEIIIVTRQMRDHMKRIITEEVTRSHSINWHDINLCYAALPDESESQ